MRRIVSASSVLFAAAAINAAGSLPCFAQAPAQAQTSAALRLAQQRTTQSADNARFAGRQPAAAGLPSAPLVSSYGIGSSGVIRPSASLSIDPFAFSPFFGYPSINLGFPQPLGHQIMPTGPNGYIYRPVTDLGTLVDQALAALRAADYDNVLLQLDPVLTEAPDDGTAWLIRAGPLRAGELREGGASPAHGHAIVAAGRVGSPGHEAQRVFPLE